MTTWTPYHFLQKQRTWSQEHLWVLKPLVSGIRRVHSRPRLFRSQLRLRRLSEKNLTWPSCSKRLTKVRRILSLMPWRSARLASTMLSFKKATVVTASTWLIQDLFPAPRSSLERQTPLSLKPTSQVRPSVSSPCFTTRHVPRLLQPTKTACSGSLTGTLLITLSRMLHLKGERSTRPSCRRFPSLRLWSHMSAHSSLMPSLRCTWQLDNSSFVRVMMAKTYSCYKTALPLRLKRSAQVLHPNKSRTTQLVNTLERGHCWRTSRERLTLLLNLTAF